MGLSNLRHYFIKQNNKNIRNIKLNNIFIVILLKYRKFNIHVLIINTISY